jgi:hypothetical protein
MAKELHGWKITTGDGVVTFSKGEHTVETTFTDPDAVDLAYDHALAQAYALDNPKHDLAGMNVDEQWRVIRGWARKGE